jgi:hypothetical protein
MNLNKKVKVFFQGDASVKYCWFVYMDGNEHDKDTLQCKISLCLFHCDQLYN